MLTIVMTYYDQLDMMAKQLQNWLSYDSDMINLYGVKFVIVDDCSKQGVPEEFYKNLPLDISVYRITDDIYFNVPGAVNLGASMAETSWILKQDMDTILPNDSLISLLNILRTDKGNTIYKYFRVNGTETSSPNKIAPGQFCIRKKDFWKIGAWDEDFCGAYGMNDPAFFYRANKMRYNVDCRRDVEVYIDQDGESEINRDVTVNKDLYEKKTNNLLPWSRRFLRFSWICEGSV